MQCYNYIMVDPSKKSRVVTIYHCQHLEWNIQNNPVRMLMSVRIQRCMSHYYESYPKGYSLGL